MLRKIMSAVVISIAMLSIPACVAEFEDGELMETDESVLDKPGVDDAEDVYKSANLALSASTSASTTFCWGTGLHCYYSHRINDGSRNTTVGGYYSWANNWGEGISLPQWVELDFGSPISFNRVELYTSSGYQIRDYDIQYWNGSGWYNAVSVNGNTSVHRTHKFGTRTASRIRVNGRRGPDNQSIYVRVNELEVYHDTCTPHSCYPWECGYVSNGCGGMNYCGSCDDDCIPYRTDGDESAAICPFEL